MTPAQSHNVRSKRPARLSDTRFKDFSSDLLKPPPRLASNPALRELAGARRAASIDDVLEAVSALDRDPSRSPGRKLFRQKSTSRVALAA